MRLQFHKLKLILSKKKGNNETQETRYGKLFGYITDMLRGNQDNVKSIKLQDAATKNTIELIGGDKEAK